MNRESEQHFAEIPHIEKPRSKFRIGWKHATSFDAGQIVPIMLKEVLPGDTLKMNTACVIRMATPLYPIFDNIEADIMYFFVPYRLVWTHWREFWGENTNAWYQTVEYQVPQLKTGTASDQQFKPKSLADYFGLPINVSGLSVSHLPFRSYVKLVNDWFRDENLQQEYTNVNNDSDLVAAVTSVYRGGLLAKANKLHDYFTSCLPSPQKGPDVTLPLGAWAPVTTRNLETGIDPTDTMMWKNKTGLVSDGNYNIMASGNSTLDSYNATIAQAVTGSATGFQIAPSNLWTDLSQASAATINAVRTAFAVQRFYEALSRGGSRYIEFLKNIFGVTSPDARLQRSEYLGGKRIPIQINQVLQTSSTDSTSPQGNTGAYSHTADADEYFTKSFTEHGICIGVCVLRYQHTYNQGIERFWSRKKWSDFYIPQFAHLSEMPVLNKEIYATGTAADDEVFGYQEAWADYRYSPNYCTSAMRTTYSQSLDAWHLADHYTQQPILGSTWIQEDKTNIDRTLAVSSNVENQFIADFYFDTTWVRTMPLYSVPGLVDHF